MHSTGGWNNWNVQQITLGMKKKKKKMGGVALCWAPHTPGREVNFMRDCLGPMGSSDGGGHDLSLDVLSPAVEIRKC